MIQQIADDLDGKATPDLKRGGAVMLGAAA
jgi:hypothetical protein